jgi:hypothetical protein
MCDLDFGTTDTDIPDAATKQKGEDKVEEKDKVVSVPFVAWHYIVLLLY